MDSAIDLPTELATFVGSVSWTFAKTMPAWPHEYIVRGRVDEGQGNRILGILRA
jgi:hypothetical protein